MKGSKTPAAYSERGKNIPDAAASYGLKERTSMRWQIEVAGKKGYTDSLGNSIEADIRDLGVRGVSKVRTARIFVLEGNLTHEEARRAAEELLSDPVTENYAINEPLLKEDNGVSVVKVMRKPGVMDPVAHSTARGIRDMGMEAESVATAKAYAFHGEISDEDKQTIVEKILVNAVIEDVIHGTGPLPEVHLDSSYQFRLQEVDIFSADDDTLMEISTQGELSLNLAEMHTIRDHFAALGRKPTDVELETLAQTWSEHCVHKTFRGLINFNGTKIDNLLKSTIAAVTRELNKPWCVSVFEDNAGVIEFDETYNVCFKVETHNHPSALDPYGGAGTGIGGVIRDPLGTGLGAKPIVNTDIFCFGPPDYPFEKLPPGALHPKRIFKGVVAGVRDYGNRMGIPTVNGAIFFDERYVGNPLVYCGNVGLIPKDKCFGEARTGDAVVVVGGKTGRDGIHGATFSSVELHQESEKTSSGAVQIGDPITEKKVADMLLAARDSDLYTCITDCGAGGLSSAVGEMGAALGAEVDLEKVPLKYHGLSYTEIWISEAQERMVLAVLPENIDELLALFASEDVEATVIGRYTDTKKLVLRYEGNVVADLDMNFLHDGLPKLEREAVWEPPNYPQPRLPDKNDYSDDLLKLLSSWNVCSKEWVIRQYDHEVQGSSVLKPLVGADNSGPGDAAVIAPVLGSTRGIIIANGMNPKYGDLDPYHMAASAIDEALRQVTAVGGSRKKVALLDNFSWGNTNKPDRLGGLVRAAQACYDIAKAYETPFISGKDSLNNEYLVDGGAIAIPPSLLISAIAVMDDVTKAVSMDAKAAGNLVYLVGLTRPEMGCSHYYALHGEIGRDVPKVDTALGRKVMDAISDATERRLVRSCHDCSEGGFAVAAAEMAFAGGLGMRLTTQTIPHEGCSRDDELLFSESNSRFVVEVAPQNRQKFEQCLEGVPFGVVGEVTGDDRLVIENSQARAIVDAPLADLKEAWQAPLRW